MGLPQRALKAGDELCLQHWIRAQLLARTAVDAAQLHGPAGAVFYIVAKTK
jgi:hypothetical protein